MVNFIYEVILMFKLRENSAMEIVLIRVKVLAEVKHFCVKII
jgi:hypothetical protein